MSASSSAAPAALLIGVYLVTPWLQGPIVASPGSGPAADLIPFGSDSLGPAFNIGGEPVYGAAAGMQAPSAIESDGTDYLVVWDDLRNGSWDVYGARVTADRRLVDSSGIAISIRPGDQGHPAVAFDGTCYFVVWEDRRSGICEIYGTRVGVDGHVFDPLGIRIAAGGADLRNPDIAFDGTNHMVVWQDSTFGSYDLPGLRINTEGNVVDSVRVPAWSGAGEQVTPRVAFDGTNFLVAWADGYYECYDILGIRVGTDGEAIDSLAIPISTAAGEQTAPDVACGDGTWLVAWHDIRAGFGLDEIYGARISAEGLVLDAAGIPVSGGPYDAQNPKVCFDGANYLVVWYDSRDGVGVRAVRVTNQGGVLDSPAIDVSEGSNGGWAAAAGFNGTDYLIAWKGYNPYDLCGVRVGVDGAVIDSLPADFSLAASDQSAAAAASDGTNYLAVWHELRNGEYDIYGARVAPDGEVLDPHGIPISINQADQEQPAVAFDGENFLVVWQDSRIESYGYPHTIYGARVSRGGAVLDPTGIMISAAPAYQSFPDVAFDGASYFVVWQREVLGPYTDLFGARVTPAGAVIDTAGIAISTAPNGQAHAAVAFDGSNYLVVWEDMRGGHRNDVYCARVTPAGEVVDGAGIAVCTAVWHQSYPDVAYDGTSYLVVWHDQRNGTSFDIYGARVGTDGSVLDPDGIPVSTDIDDQTNPAVVYDGSVYFVAWKGHRDGFFDVDGACVSREGVVLDPEGFAISRADQNQLAPGVALGSYRRLLVAYSSFTPQDYGSYRIWGKLYGDCAGVPGEPGTSDAPALRAAPNPFLASTALRFYLPREARVSIGIYDATGRAVSKIADGIWSPGTHQITWDGSLDGGRPDDRTAPPGVYFVRFEADGHRDVRKMVRLK